ncbi:MAG: FAD binding domain-containing protein [Pseudomonadota bacterium]|nr:FAD binding domain-containing protein [Pseudomonadota bacterium]
MTTTPSAAQLPVKTLRFIRRGEVVSLGVVAPDRTLLEVLREDLGLTGTKEGCGEGDCGACTVVLGDIENGALRYRAINSCIRLAHSIDGMALWTVQDIAAQEGRLHPAQQAMVQCHASQCGFCTPGFVMSLFSLYQNHVCQGQAISRTLAQETLSGNLCRCTGYRPILDAAQMMASLPPVRVDEAALLEKLDQLAQCAQPEPEPSACASTSASAFVRPQPSGATAVAASAPQAAWAYQSPRTLAGLLQLRATHPDAQLVAGCTDVGLWVTKQHRQLAQIIDLTQVQELRRIEEHPQHLAIGAAVTLNDAFTALLQERPQLHGFATRFAGLPVRNAGTLGGNVANGSPIGDSMPLLIALGASIVLMSVRGQRELPLEALYTGYRQNVMAADEVLAWVKVPRPPKPPMPGMGNSHSHPLPEGKGVQAGTQGGNETRPKVADLSVRGNKEGQYLPESAPSLLFAEEPAEGQEFLRIYKISKRYDDDISAVCLAIKLHLNNGLVTHASMGAGGVAATPARAVETEAALLGQPWTAQTVQRAIAVLRAEFKPLSDMRASAAYRTEVLGNLLQRYWLESQGLQQINLASFDLEEGA